MKTLLEDRLGATAQSRRPTRSQIRLAREFDNDVLKFSKAFTRDIAEVLEKLGREIERVALEVLDSQKNAGQDAMDAALINEAVDIAGIETEMTTVYIKHYKKIIDITGERINAVMDLGFMSNAREAEILGNMVNRATLLDLPGAMKRGVFRQLQAGRAEGESVVQLARRLRDFIPAGRFTGGLNSIKNPTQAQIEAAGKRAIRLRSTLIARTEATNAQKVAAAETYRAGGVTMVLILDSRKGSFDAQCDALDGKLVSLQEGEALMADEHPNGTRRMIAQPPDIVEDLG